MRRRRWFIRHGKPRARSKLALLVVALRLATAVAGAGVLALPTAANAATPGEASGSVAAAPGYTWDVTTTSDGLVTIVTVIGPFGVPSTPVWASWNGGPWYYTNANNGPGSIWTEADPSAMPSFMDPSSGEPFNSFVNQLLGVGAPPLPPSLYAPPGTPPALDPGTTDPGDDPGTGSGGDPPGEDPGDYLDGSVDPGAVGGGGGDPGLLLG